MVSWFIYTLLGGICLGSAYYFRKLTSKSLSSTQGFVAETLFLGLLILIFFLFQKNKQEIFSKPLFPFLSAVFLFLAALLLYKALPLGKLSLTTVIYSLTTFGTVILISFILLNEQLGPKQILGLILAFISIILLRS